MNNELATAVWAPWRESESAILVILAEFDHLRGGILDDWQCKTMIPDIRGIGKVFRWPKATFDRRIASGTSWLLSRYNGCEMVSPLTPRLDTQSRGDHLYSDREAVEGIINDQQSFGMYKTSICDVKATLRVLGELTRHIFTSIQAHRHKWRDLRLVIDILDHQLRSSNLLDASGADVAWCALSIAVPYRQEGDAITIIFVTITDSDEDIDVKIMHRSLKITWRSSLAAWSSVWGRSVLGGSGLQLEPLRFIDTDIGNTIWFEASNEILYLYDYPKYSHAIQCNISQPPVTAVSHL